MHLYAAFYSPKLNVPAAVQPPNNDQLHQNSLVQSLRNALLSAINEIKFPKEENKALNE